MHVAEGFFEDLHSQSDCTSCHGGDSTKEDKDEAHVGVVHDPTGDADNNPCTTCHSAIVEEQKASIHFNLNGYFTAYEARAGRPAGDAYNEMFKAECGKCHATCGQCHISQPATVGGGLIWGHEIHKTPNPFRTCTACHGSRVGEEYKGEREGYGADVHFAKGKNCMFCHDTEEMHSSKGNHRYEVDKRADCKDCHADLSTGGANAKADQYHTMHGDKLSCQVCHSQAYKNCYQCHVGKGTQKPSEIDFRIGKNPRKDATRPWDYVVLRHVPIVPNTYSEHDPSMTLPNYTSKPTWVMATPHNIKKSTPQTAGDGLSGCSNCHKETCTDPKALDCYFLTTEYIDARIADGVMVTEEKEANAPVVTTPPAAF